MAFTKLRCGEVNLQMSAAATSERNRIVLEQKLDLVLFQEPYVPFDKVVGLIGDVFVSGDQPMAGVHRINKNIDVVKMDSVSNSHHMCVQIVGLQHKIWILSSYFQSRDDARLHLDRWDVVLDVLRNKPVILAADVNAKSEMWHSSVTDESGDEVSQYILANDLYVMNVEGQLPTYRSPAHGTESNIDVTLTNSHAERLIHNWCVTEDSSSDHRLIVFEISQNKAQDPGNICLLVESRYIHNNADWCVFDKSLIDELRTENVNMNQPNMDGKIAALTRVIANTCERTLKDTRRGLPCM